MNIINDELNPPPDSSTTVLPVEGAVETVGAPVGDAVVVEGAPEGEQTTAAAEKTKFNVWSLVYEVAETIVLAVIIWLVVNFATARFIVEGSSMEPNFHTGQMLIVSRLSYKLSSPKRGDVIVFQYPDNPVDDYIKRVIGVPGDTVEIEDGRVYINGQVVNEPYLSNVIPDSQRGKWTVPEGSYFVMGDNRPHSSDSRSWGMLSGDLIIGKAWISYWPPSLWGIVPQVTYDGVSP
jgi:signal peptidase I